MWSKKAHGKLRVFFPVVKMEIKHTGVSIHLTVISEERKTERKTDKEAE